MTDYLILRKDMDETLTEDDGPSVWYLLDGVYRASSAKRALDVAALTIEGSYVAVPIRSWNPLDVKIEQTTKITIG